MDFVVAIKILIAVLIAFDVPPDFWPKATPNEERPVVIPQPTDSGFDGEKVAPSPKHQTDVLGSHFVRGHASVSQPAWTEPAHAGDGEE